MAHSKERLRNRSSRSLTNALRKGAIPPLFRRAVASITAQRNPASKKVHGERVSPVSEVSECPSMHVQWRGAEVAKRADTAAKKCMMLLRTGERQWTPGCSRK